MIEQGEFELLQSYIKVFNDEILTYGFCDDSEQYFINKAIELGLRPTVMGIVRKENSHGKYEYLLMPTLINEGVSARLVYAPIQGGLNKLKDYDIFSKRYLLLDGTLQRELFEETGVIAPENIQSYELLHSAAILQDRKRIGTDKRSEDNTKRSRVGNFYITYLVEIKMPMREDGLGERNIVLGNEYSGQRILAWTLNQIPQIEINFWYSWLEFKEMLNSKNNPVSIDKRALFNELINIMESNSRQ